MTTQLQRLAAEILATADSLRQVRQMVWMAQLPFENDDVQALLRHGIDWAETLERLAQTLGEKGNG